MEMAEYTRKENQPWYELVAWFLCSFSWQMPGTERESQTADGTNGTCSPSHICFQNQKPCMHCLYSESIWYFSKLDQIVGSFPQICYYEYFHLEAGFRKNTLNLEKSLSLSPPGSLSRDCNYPLCLPLFPCLTFSVLKDLLQSPVKTTNLLQTFMAFRSELKHTGKAIGTLQKL